ncbi:MAG: hypothetical protein FJX72_21840 [Armatimonadetes bacterium]|nr:hypothetical protein [Armatimonadota bacterium]
MQHYISRVMEELLTPQAMADLIVNIVASVLTVVLFVAAGMLYHGCLLTKLYRVVLSAHFGLTHREASAAMRFRNPEETLGSLSAIVTRGVSLPDEMTTVCAYLKTVAEARRASGQADTQKLWDPHWRGFYAELARRLAGSLLLRDRYAEYRAQMGELTDDAPSCASGPHAPVSQNEGRS